jgi:Sec-independent protein translocase protein TatA
MRLRKITISLGKLGRHMKKEVQQEEEVCESQQDSPESDGEYECLCQSDSEADNQEQRVTEARDKLEGALSALFKLEDERADLISRISSFYWQDKMPKYRKLMRRSSRMIEEANEELKQAMKEYDELRADNI